MNRKNDKVNMTVIREKSDIEKKNVSEDGQIIMKVMYTGGFDSTYRILELSFEPVIIQPYYIYNKNRISRDIELETAKKLLEMIKARDTTKADIRDLLVSNLEEYLPVSEDILEGYRTVRKTSIFGAQYPWLNQVGKSIEGMQISTETLDDVTPKTRFIYTMHQRDRIKYYEDNPALCISQLTLKDTPKEYYVMLNNLYFPENILNLSKAQMLDNFKKWNAVDIAEATWFCHYPVKNEPCGWCIPCIGAVEKTGIWRVQGKSLRRYKLRKFYRAKFQIKKFFDLSFKKIKSIFKKEEK